MPLRDHWKGNKKTTGFRSTNQKEDSKCYPTGWFQADPNQETMLDA